jgi:preprotein translocase subunit SecE
MHMSNYLKEVQAEMRHVNWPNRRQIVLYTTIVVIISFAVAYYLGVFDALFTWIFETYIL